MSQPHRILQTTALPVDAQPGALLGEAVPVLDAIAEPEAWLDRHGGEVECLITHSLRGAEPALVERLANLRLIANFGAGLDRIDLDDAQRRGVTVTASGDVLTDDVADLAIWLVLSLLRGNVAADAFVRSGRWRERPFPLGRGARGRRLGIWGYGRIGQAIAARGQALGMAIGYHSRRPVADAGHDHHPSPLALASWADLLVVALPGGASTRKLVGAEILSALGSTGALVNIARGSVVDEEALVDALHSGALGAAALDVFEQEPDIDDRLLEAPRLLLSPHLGSATADSRRAMLDHVVDNIVRWRGGKAPIGAIVTA